MTLEHYYDSAWRDISDYVDRIESLPRAFRNRDYSLRAEIISSDIAVTIRDSAIYADDFTFTDGDKFRVKDNSSTIIWNGELETSHYNYREEIFELRIRPHLFKLKDQFVDYATLHILFAAGGGTQYWTDHYGFTSVQLLYGLECLFTACGISVYIPAAIGTTSLFTRTTDGVNWIETEITFADLYFDEYQLYCLNQTIATLYSTIDDAANDYIGSKIRCWDLVSEILQKTKLVLLPYGDEGYQIAFNTGNYTVTDDNSYEYDRTKVAIDIDQDGLGCRYLTDLTPSPLRPNRTAYYSAAASPVDPPGVVGKGSELTVINNFTILFADAKNRLNGFDADFEERMCYIYLSSTLGYGTGTADATLNLIASQFADKSSVHEYETILTAYQSTFESIEEHAIDPQWETSEIKQEL